MPVETHGLFIDGIDDDGDGGDLRRLNISSAEGVHDKKLSHSLPSVPLIDGEAAEKRSRHDGIGRKFPGHVRGQAAQVNAEGGERIIAENGFGGRCGDKAKGRGHESAGVLAGYLFQIAVKDFVAAREGRAVVLFAKRLDKQPGFAGSRRHLFAGMLFIAARRVAQTGSAARSFQSTLRKVNIEICHDLHLFAVVL